MGVTGKDIQLSEAAKKKFPYAVECKSRAKIALIYEAMGQASANADGDTPIAIVKQNQSDPLVVMRIEDFFRLIRENQKDN